MVIVVEESGRVTSSVYQNQRTIEFLNGGAMDWHNLCFNNLGKNFHQLKIAKSVSLLMCSVRAIVCFYKPQLFYFFFTFMSKFLQNFKIKICHFSLIYCFMKFFKNRKSDNVKMIILWNSLPKYDKTWVSFYKSAIFCAISYPILHNILVYNCNGVSILLLNFQVIESL
jgi:hypothetical protein